MPNAYRYSPGGWSVPNAAFLVAGQLIFQRRSGFDCAVPTKAEAVHVKVGAFDLGGNYCSIYYPHPVCIAFLFSMPLQRT
jgi:hypothetical protein